MKKVILSEYLKNHRLSKQDICDYVICVNNMMLKTERTSTICFNSENVYVTHENPLILEFSVSESLNIDAHYEISKNLLKLLRHTDVEDKEALHEGYDLFCRSSKDGYKMTDLLAICDKYADITLVNKTLESMSNKELSSIEEIKSSYKANKEKIGVEKEIPTVDIDINNFKSINIEDKITKEQRGIDKDKFIKYLYENKKIANRNSENDFENQNIIAHLYYQYIDGDFFITNFEEKNGSFLLYGYCHYGDDILAQPEYISLNSLYNYAETVEKINKGTYYEIIKKPISLQLETNEFVFGQRVKDFVKSNNQPYGMEKMVKNIDFNDNINKFKIIKVDIPKELTNEKGNMKGR